MLQNLPSNHFIVKLFSPRNAPNNGSKIENNSLFSIPHPKKNWKATYFSPTKKMERKARGGSRKKVKFLVGRRNITSIIVRVIMFILRK